MLEPEEEGADSHSGSVITRRVDLGRWSVSSSRRSVLQCYLVSVAGAGDPALFSSCCFMEETLCSPTLEIHYLLWLRKMRSLRRFNWLNGDSHTSLGKLPLHVVGTALVSFPTLA